MRRTLDLTYRICELLAAFFLASLGALILAQIVGRLFGVLVPGADDLAIYSMAASAFLALGPALRAGAHIRVGLVIDFLGRRGRTFLEAACLLAGTALVGYFTWYAFEMTRFSWMFGDVSQGLVPIPLWIPQAGMTLGLLVLVVAFLDDLAALAAGRQPSYSGKVGEEG